MLDVRSKHEKVDNEQRKHQRLELHCKAMLRGINGISTVTDISLAGVFLEPEKPFIARIGSISEIKIKLPIENAVISTKVKFINQNKRGVGCEFISLDQNEERAIKQCLEEFRYTLPIKEKDEKVLDNDQLIDSRFVSIDCPRCSNKKQIDLSNGIIKGLRVKLKCSCGHRWSINIDKKQEI